MMLVFGKGICSEIPQALQETWFQSYCALLDRQQLWMLRSVITAYRNGPLVMNHRSEVVQACWIKELKELTLESLVFTICNHCKKPVKLGWICDNEKCRKLTSKLTT